MYGVTNSDLAVLGPVKMTTIRLPLRLGESVAFSRTSTGVLVNSPLFHGGNRCGNGIDVSGPRCILPVSPYSAKLSLLSLLGSIAPTLLAVSSLLAYYASDTHGIDALFPSENVTPLVLKLTTWSCLFVVVIYEQIWLWTKGPNQWLYDSTEIVLEVQLIGWDDNLDTNDDKSSTLSSTRRKQNETGTKARASLCTQEDDYRKDVAQRPVSKNDFTKAAITVHIDSPASRAGIELKEISNKASASGPLAKSLVSVKSVSDGGEAASLGVRPGMLLMDYPNKSSVVERIKNGPYPVVLRFAVGDSSIRQDRPEGGDLSLQSISAPPAEEIPPHRFIAAEKGNIESARKRYVATLKWRSEMGMDHIITDPHPNFTLIKKNYPHYYHLRGRKHEPCYYEKPPEINLKSLRAAGVTMDDLLRHFALTCDFMWTVIEPSESGKSIYVIDLRGMGMRDFAGEVVDFVKKTSTFTAAHYPERSGSIFVINVPSWFSIIWKTVSPWIDPVTVNKITILGYGDAAITKALEAKIPPENIPPEYGGQSMPLGQSPEEAMFREKMAGNWRRHEHED